MNLPRLRAPRTYVPGAPSVNLAPGETRDIATIATHRRRLVTGAALLTIVVSGVFIAQQAHVDAAQHALDEALATQASLTADQAALAPVQVYYQDIAAAQAQVQQAMSREVLFSQIAQRLQDLAPAAVSVDTLTVTADTAPISTTDADTTSAATSCTSDNPFQTTSAIGCAVFSGIAVSRTDIGDLLTALNADEHFQDAFASATTADQETGQFTYTVSVGLTDAAYSARWADTDFLIGATK